MKALLKLFKILFICSGLFFIITFIIYIGNFDMKLTAMLQPTIQKWQEKVPRDRHL